MLILPFGPPVLALAPAPPRCRRRPIPPRPCCIPSPRRSSSPHLLLEPSSPFTPSSSQSSTPSPAPSSSSYCCRSRRPRRCGPRSPGHLSPCLRRNNKWREVSVFSIKNRHGFAFGLTLPAARAHRSDRPTSSGRRPNLNRWRPAPRPGTTRQLTEVSQF